MEHPLMEYAGLAGALLLRLWFPLTIWLITIATVRFLWIKGSYFKADSRGRLPVRRAALDANADEAFTSIERSQAVDLMAAANQQPHMLRIDTRYHTSARPGLTTTHDETRPESPLPFVQWWPNVRDHHSHIDLIGQNTSGKTTLATAVLTERAKTDKIVILDLHAKFNRWAGLPAIGAGRNVQAVEQAVYVLHEEFERRFRLGEPVEDRLTVFIDEYPALALLLPAMVPMVKQWLREAPKAGIRLVLLAQEPNARTFGFDGEAAIRRNMLHVLLGEYAAEASDIAAQQEYPAVLKKHGKALPLDVTRLPDLARQTLDPSVLWSVPQLEQSGTGVTPSVTAEHAQVAYWLGLDPTLSAREVARRLWPNKSSGGRNAQAAAKIMEEVRSVTVTGVGETADFEDV